MPQLDMNKCVNDGADLLTNVFGSTKFVDYISIPDLDLSAPSRCVLGQLAPVLTKRDTNLDGYSLARDAIEEAVGMPETETWRHWCVEYGFLTHEVVEEPDRDDYYDDIEDYEYDLKNYQVLKHTFGDSAEWDEDTQYEFLTSVWRRKIAQLYYERHREWPSGWERIDYEERGLDYDAIKGES